jgi:hypothetical protein
VRSWPIICQVGDLVFIPRARRSSPRLAPEGFPNEGMGAAVRRGLAVPAACAAIRPPRKNTRYQLFQALPKAKTAGVGAAGFGSGYK